MPFDRIVTVDWSGASTPRAGKDSIWVCDLDVASECWSLVNPPTRQRAEALLRDLLRGAARHRVLLAVDVALAYPAGFADAAGLGGEGPPWERTWQHLEEAVVDDDRNRSNRFAVAAALNERIGGGGPGPFWGCPPAAAGPTLATRKPSRYPFAGLAELRVAEAVMRAAGHRVLSPWQLYGAGSVGSQTLTGIPVLARLRCAPDLAGRIRLWPCETGFVPDPAQEPGAVVVAECWPGIVPLDPWLHEIRDAAQVLGLARHLAALQRAGELGAWLAPDLDDAARHVALDEEGWILGAALPCAAPSSGR